MADEILISMIRSLALESGVVTSIAEIGTTKLVDNTKDWSPNKYRDCIVRIIGGSGTGQLALINSNTANSLQVTPAWTVGLDSSSVYVICKPEVNSETITILDLLRDSGFGLNALRTLVNAIEGKLDSETFGLAALLNVLNMGTRPLVNLYEGWQDEAGIDPTIWTVTNPATGTAWARDVDEGDLTVFSFPNANETARLRSNQRWVVSPTLYGPSKILKRFVLEFEMRLANVGNLDNTLCFFGLTPGVGNNRSSPNIIGFSLLADVLETLTDLLGVETSNTGFGETLTDRNKFRIDVFLNTVRFYLNETLIATHTTNLPSNMPKYLNFFIDTEASGAASIRLGVIRAWTEDIAR